MKDTLRFDMWRLCEHMRLTADACQARYTYYPRYSIPVSFLNKPSTTNIGIAYSDDTKFTGRHSSLGLCRVSISNTCTCGTSNLYYRFGNGFDEFPLSGKDVPQYLNCIEEEYQSSLMASDEDRMKAALKSFQSKASMYYEGSLTRSLYLIQTVVGHHEDFFGSPGVYVLSYDEKEWNFPYVIVEDLRNGTTMTRIPDPYHFIDEFRNMEMRVLNDGFTHVCFVNKDDPKEDWVRLNELSLENARLTERVLLSISSNGINVAKY